MKSDFSKRLKELRTEKGLSQHQLAKNLNHKITQSAIGLWERGKRIPNLDLVIILADYFCVSLDYIAGRED
ncbi:MAG: helix-turn-helix transcriptional regulator [Clostridia bacterium]|nr:helix-turn-helix transcriptional regulator [Clostridia bacterium]